MINLISILILFFSTSLALAANDESIYDKIDLFGEVLDKVNKEYVDEINQSDAMDAAINGVLQSLDPYSAYMSPELFKEMQTETSGEFGGLGIEVGMEAGVVKVITPMDNSPAEQAGVKAGDYIVKIDGIQVQGKTLTEAVDLMRGPVGSPIEITIRRVGEKIDGLLGSNIFPFNYPISHTENFLRQLEKWEFAIPLNFMWLVHIEEIPTMITTEYMHNLEPTGGEQSSGAIDKPGAYHTGWDIDRGKIEITRDDFMKAAGGVGGCILAQGVNIPGESYAVNDVAIENNMGFLPGKVGGNRAGLPQLTIEFRETNRSFTDLVIRPWMILASHMGMVARPMNDYRKIKTNIHPIPIKKP